MNVPPRDEYGTAPRPSAQGIQPFALRLPGCVLFSCALSLASVIRKGGARACSRCVGEAERSGRRGIDALLARRPRAVAGGDWLRARAV